MIVHTEPWGTVVEVIVGTAAEVIVQTCRGAAVEVIVQTFGAAVEMIMQTYGKHRSGDSDS